MSSELLHDAFALLLREHEGEAAALSASAALAIRRRVAARWVGGVGALAIVTSLAAAALLGPGDEDADRAVIERPVPTPTIGFAKATFPLTGGPEFVPASAGLECGDHAPAPHPIDRDLTLIINRGSVFAPGGVGIDPWPPIVQAVVRQTTTANKGTIATSGIDFLVVRDGIIRGVIDGSGVSLSQNVVGGTVSIPQSLLVAGGIYCPDGGQAGPSAIEEGTYDVVAIGRFFSTAESVALSQVLGDTINTMYLNPNDQADPTAVYLPGIYGCEEARAWDSALRGCLPEISDTAVVDEVAGTVTVSYRTRELVEEFSVVLVSEPLAIELASEGAA
ncbi:MAG: hypothetical protein HGA51_09665 [Demequinaceae bacterium]|nr:hypothetical protein [Demequinaceae bacterium]